MKNINDSNYVDVLFVDDNEEFKAKFLMSDVEKEINEKASTIMYWGKRYNFEKYIERINNNKDRYFSMNQVNLLRKIKTLRDNGMRSPEIEKEIKDDIEILKNRNKNIIVKNEQDQQMVQQQNIDQIANAIKESLLQDIAVLIKDNQVQMENNITEKVSKQLESKKEEIIKELSISMLENKESIENTIQDTVKTSSDDIRTILGDSTSKLSTTLNSGLEDGLNRFKSYGDELEQKFSNRDEINMANLRESMEKQLEKNRLEEIQKREEKKKGFLDKISGIFGK